MDFYASLPDGQECLVQVCVDLSQPETLARAVRALQEARQDWPDARLLLVTMHVPPAIAVPAPIELHRATTWLLEPEIPSAEN